MTRQVVIVFVVGLLALSAPWRGETASVCGEGQRCPPMIQTGIGGAGRDSGRDVPGGIAIQDAGFAAPHRAFPHIPITDGRLLIPMTLVTIAAANDADREALFQFSDDLIQSDWWSAVAGDFGVPRPKASMRLTGAAITADVTSTQIIEYIQQTIAGGPEPNGTRLYLVYLPEGVKVKSAFFCAFHTAFPDTATTLGDGWAVVTRQCLPFKGGETKLDALTRIGSHEIIEGATNPITRGFTLGATPRKPWTASIWRSYRAYGQVEVADLCEGTRQFIDHRRGGSWAYQRSWSNQAAAAGGDPCVPATKEPHFNVSVPQDWYAGAAGSQVSIPLTGWSTAPRDPWLLFTHIENGSPRFFPRKTDFLRLTTEMGPLRIGAGCAAFPGMNNGRTGTLTVHIPPDAQPGDFAVLGVHSFEEDPRTCYPYLDRDHYRLWLVGVYIPEAE